MIGRSVAAVLVGFLTVALLSVGTDAVMHATGVFPAPGVAMSDGLFGLALAYRTVYTVLGGALCARIAPSRPMRHVGVLAALGQLGGLGGVAAWYTANDPALGPLWYPVAIAVLAIPGVVLGGYRPRNR